MTWVSPFVRHEPLRPMPCLPVIPDWKASVSKSRVGALIQFKHRTNTGLTQLWLGNRWSENRYAWVPMSWTGFRFRGIRFPTCHLAPTHFRMKDRMP